MTLDEASERERELQKVERAKFAEYNQVLGMISEIRRLIAVLKADKAQEEVAESAAGAGSL